MFKNIFKSAKKLLKNPVVQLGIGALLPGMLPASMGLLRNPAILQGGIGLLAGDKPENVLRNLAVSSAMGGIGNLGQEGGFTKGATDFFRSPQSTATASQNKQAASNSGYLNESADFGNNKIVEQAAQGGEGFLRDSGLVVDTINDPVTGLPRQANFFEKYGNIIKLGTVGASVAAAALGAQDAAKLYDPNQNPYLQSGSGSKDFFEGVNPVYQAKGGGIGDFPRKTGMIDGPGNGQSDDIPAMLSDGEFVMTKQAVMAAGDGDREKGTRKMYSMMNGLEDKAQGMGIGRM